MRPSQVTSGPSKKFDGNRPSRPAGALRPGIRRLTAKGRNDPKAVAAYRKALAAGATFEKIAESVKNACGYEATAPQNVPYFTLRECVMPEIMEMILERYGVTEDIEGVPTKVIKRLPISMYSDLVEENLDYQFEAYNASGMRFWGASANPDEYSEERGIGPGVRVCRTFKAVPMTQYKGEARAARLFGGRPTEARKKCEPGSCQEFMSGECNLRGKLYFHIPGIGISAPFEMPVGSKLFGIEAEQTLDLVREATGGNLTRFERPVFFLTKERRNISIVDGESGKPKRVDQWITVLEAAVDVPKLRLIQGSAQTRALGVAGAALLNGSPPSTEESTARPIETAERNDGEFDASKSQTIVDASSPTPPALPELAPPQSDTTVGLAQASSGRSLQVAVGEAAKNAGFETPDRMKAFAVAEYGADWIRSESALIALRDRLNSIGGKRVALIAAIRAAGIDVEEYFNESGEPSFWDFSLEGIDARLSQLTP